MVQVSKHIPKTPKLAAGRSAPIDKALNAEIFKALGDSTRLKLLACLAKCSRPCSVSEIAECCDIDLSVISRHLAILARAGIAVALKEGRTVFYSVRYQAISRAMRDIADAFDSCCTTGVKGSCCG
jgi:ArsR family transcriptional regulator, arsenate/arsenite/antimonite-responsive transcriptional repressor